MQTLGADPSDYHYPATVYASLTAQHPPACLQAANLRLLMNAKVHAGMPLQPMAGNQGLTFGVVNAVGQQEVCGLLRVVVWPRPVV